LTDGKKTDIGKSKAIGYCFLAIVGMTLAQVIAVLIESGLKAVHLPEPVCYLLSGILYPVTTYFFIKLFAGKVMHRDMRSFHIPRPGIRIRWLIIGILLPVIVSAVLMLFPGRNVKGTVTSESVSNIFYCICFCALGAAFAEEMTFRGVIMTLLKEQYNVKIAVIVPSILFGLLHLMGQELSLMMIVQIAVAGTLVGIMFSLIALESGSVWNSGIVHFFWNAVTLNGIFLVGSKASEDSIYTYVLESDSVLLSGGDFGLDISVVAMIGYAVVIAAAYSMLKKKRRISE